MKLTYCIECGARLEPKNKIEYVCTNGHTYYNNPRIGVAIAFIKENELLFARRAHNPHKGRLDLPGGFVDPEETLEAAALREAKEELGVEITQMHYLTSNPNSYGENIYTCDAFFVATQWKGEFRPADDVASIEWHSIDIMLTDDFSWDHWRPAYPRLKELLTLE